MNINENAPVVQRNQILIEASPEQVWEVLTNINQWPVWNKKITKASLAQSLSNGSQFAWKVNGANIRSTLHTVEPTQAFGWSGKGFGASAIHNWYLEKQGNGTLVKVEESMEGWLISLFKGKMNRDLAKDMQHWLEVLKMECER